MDALRRFLRLIRDMVGSSHYIMLPLIFFTQFQFISQDSTAASNEDDDEATSSVVTQVASTSTAVSPEQDEQVDKLMDRDENPGVSQSKQVICFDAFFVFQDPYMDLTAMIQKGGQTGSKTTVTAKSPSVSEENLATTDREGSITGTSADDNEDGEQENQEVSYFGGKLTDFW